jgi:peptide deformylase
MDREVEALIEDMIETMRAADGIGLAAVQIGVPERVIVIELPVASEEVEGETEEPGKTEEPVETELYVLINPELVDGSDELVEGIEGCLSIPGWVGEVERHQTVTVEGADRSGRGVRVRAEGLLARVLQHEIDHCQGVLFIDHIDDPERIWRVEEGQEEAAEAAQEVPPS